MEPDVMYSELIDQVEQEPILVIDTIISFLTQYGDKYQANKLNKLFNLYFSAILVHLGKPFKRKEIDMSVSEVFSSSVSAEQKAVVFSLLFELYNNYPKILRDTTLHKFYGVIDELSRSPSLSALKLDTKKQNHEKISAIEDEISRVIEEVTPAFADLGKCENLSASLAVLSRQLNKQASRLLLMTRLKPFDLLAIIRKVVASVELFQESINSERSISAYEDASEQISNLESIFTNNQTSPLRIPVLSMAANLKSRLAEMYSASEVNKKPEIVVSPVDRKYPLNELNSSFNLGMVLKNSGNGIAQNVLIKIKDSTDISIQNDSYLLGTLKSGETFTIHFNGVCSNCTKTALVEYSVSYTDLKGEDFGFDEMITLSGQDEQADWESAARRDPYSIQPVTTEGELIGRENSIDRLLTIISSDMMGSAFIYGQKRVGKTSIAQTFLNKARRDFPDTTFISYDVGNAGTGEARTTIDQLVHSLHRYIKRSDERFSRIDISAANGSLSPLATYISDIQDLFLGSKFCFILDEFDELPSALYSGELGNSFFQAIRSMTSEGDNAFILIGGEKIQRILTNQGTKLNKFDTIIVDYFDRLKQWDDFVELVRKPAMGVLEYADEVVQKIYEVSAGNPYYTKKICQTIYRNAVDKRDSYVGIEEYSRSYLITKNSAGVQSFAHFWTDGLLSSGDQIESMQYKRKCLLIGMGKALRTSLNVTFDDIYAQNPDPTISVMEMKTVLNEFVSRRIIDVVDNTYKIRVGIFRDWLVDVGVSEIIADTSEQQALLQQQTLDEEMRVKDLEIEKLVEGWPSYKHVEKGVFSVRKWLSQFETPHEQRDMFTLLNKVRIISQSDLLDWSRQAFALVRDNLTKSQRLIHYGSARKTKRDEYVVVYLESSVAKSGTGIGRLFVGVNDILGANLVSKVSIKKTFESNTNAQALFVVDDFVGTGNSVCKSLGLIPEEDIEYLKDNKIRLNFIVMISTIEGERKITEKLEELGLEYSYIVNEYLTEEDLLFTEESSVITNKALQESLRQILDKYGQKIGLDPYGYGQAGLALVFDTNCPNNTIPLLWSSRNDWYPLFERT